MDHVSHPHITTDFNSVLYILISDDVLTDTVIQIASQEFMFYMYIVTG